jgi:hypothetical protein
MHCGGPTGGPTLGADRAAVLESMLQPSTAQPDEFPEPMEFSHAGGFIPDQTERELETSDEPSSVGRSLIRGLGGFVWVIVLIGFTLARNCGGE